MSACKLRHGVPQSEVRFAGIANGRVAVNIKLLLPGLSHCTLEITYGTVGTVPTVP